VYILRIKFPDHEFLEVIETAVLVARKRKIDSCCLECYKKYRDPHYCDQYCIDKYKDNNYFTKADYIKALVYTNYIYKYKIETLLRKLRDYASKKKYIEYVDRRHGVYKKVM